MNLPTNPVTHKKLVIVTIPSPKFAGARRAPIYGGVSLLKTTIYGGLNVQFQNWRGYCVRQLFESASVQASSRYSPVSRIMAIIGFDLAVETILKAIVSSLDTREQPDKAFQGVVQQANDKLQEFGFPLLPDEANIRHVHGLRNDAQHKAKYPSDDDVKECQFFVSNFLQKVTLQLWNIEFRDISIAELVQNEKSKEYLVIAEKALFQDDFEDTIRQAYAALLWVTSNVRKQLFNRGNTLSENFDFSEVSEQVQINDDLVDAIETGFEPIRDEISYELDKIQDTLFSIAIGLNYAQYIRLQMVLPDGISFDDGKLVRQPSLFRKKITKLDAQFALNYCIDAIIQIESQIGDVENMPKPPDWEN